MVISRRCPDISSKKLYEPRAGCDNRFIEKDKSGIPYFTLETDRFYETASKICYIKKDTKRLSGLTNEFEL